MTKKKPAKRLTKDQAEIRVLNGRLRAVFADFNRDRQKVNELIKERDKARAEVAAAMSLKRKWEQTADDYIRQVEVNNNEMGRERARADRLTDAVRRALGENVPGPEFMPPDSKPGARPRPYWWRTELRRRAGFDSERIRSVPPAEVHEACGQPWSKHGRADSGTSIAAPVCPSSPSALCVICAASPGAGHLQCRNVVIYKESIVCCCPSIRTAYGLAPAAPSRAQCPCHAKLDMGMPHLSWCHCSCHGPGIVAPCCASHSLGMSLKEPCVNHPAPAKCDHNFPNRDGRCAGCGMSAIAYATGATAPAPKCPKGPHGNHTFNEDGRCAFCESPAPASSCPAWKDGIHRYDVFPETALGEYWKGRCGCGARKPAPAPKAAPPACSCARGNCRTCPTCMDDPRPCCHLLEDKEPAPPAVTLRWLQENLPWNADMSPEFQRSTVIHKEFQHALLHATKALGKLAAMAGDADQFKPEEIRLAFGGADRYLADLIICAVRMANEAPGWGMNLDEAVIARLTEKHPGWTARKGAK